MAEYIDREAAENIFNVPIWYGEFEPYTPQSHYVLRAVGKLIREEIRKIPAADVEPVRHGDWDVILDDWEDTVTLRCPLCGEEYAVDCDDDEIPQAKYSYCPGCGAKMDGGDNDAGD